MSPRCGCPTTEELDALRRLILNTMMFPYSNYREDVEKVAEAFGVQSIDAFIAGIES